MSNPILQTRSMSDVLDHYQMLMKPEYHKKKNLGQVFTPLYLVNKIIDKIPLTIMTNPKSTFFDPSAGMGGFLVILYYRLMKHLSRCIPKKEERHNHIINKMLYAAEITSNNVKRMRRIFGKEFHIYHGDTLKIDIFKSFGINTFTVIVGNPPFEKPQKYGDKKQGGSTLWIDFVDKSINSWLSSKGYMGMLLPPGWRKPSTSTSRSKGLWKLMSKDCSLLWIDMYDDKLSKEIFGKDVSIRFDLLLLQKTRSNGTKTLITTTDRKKIVEDVGTFPFLPNGNLGYWKKVLTNDNNKAFNVISSGVYDTRSKRIEREKTHVFKYPVIHAIHKDKSVVILYTNEKLKKGGFYVHKLIFNGYGGWNEPILDMKGKYGMSEVVFGLCIDSTENGKNLSQFFQNRKVLNLFQVDMVWSTSRPLIFWNMFKNIRNDIYKYKLP